MNCLRSWKNWIRPLAISLYAILFCVSLPLLIWGLHKNQTEPHATAWLIAGLFVLFTVPISLWTILQHIVHYTKPELQRHIIRILWMVPIYSIDSWFGLKYPKVAIYLDTCRECYEAYVIYNFMIYLLNFLNSEHDLVASLQAKPQQKHLIPFCCLPPWTNGLQLVQRCKWGVLLYVIVRPLTTLISLISAWAGAYHEGMFTSNNVWPYVTFINNITQIWALYCLILFYVAAKEELKPLKPVAKFLCVKLVVFFSFWQEALIAILVATKAIQGNTTWNWTVEQVATGLQDFIICVEMFVAAIAHHFAFTYTPYVDPDETVDCLSSFAHMWDVSDVKDDVVEHVKSVGNKMKQSVASRKYRSFEKPGDEKSSLLDSAQPPAGYSTTTGGGESTTAADSGGASTLANAYPDSVQNAGSGSLDTTMAEIYQNSGDQCPPSSSSQQGLETVSHHEDEKVQRDDASFSEDEVQSTP